jgi:hypothetical protein
MMMFFLGMFCIAAPIAYQLRLLWLQRVAGLSHAEANSRATVESIALLAMAVLAWLTTTHAVLP